MMTEENNNEDKFKERAYQILYENYRHVLGRIIQKSYNLENRSSQTGELLKEDRQEYIDKKIELAEDLSKLNEVWVKKGFISKEEIEVIRTLEDCLGIKHSLLARVK